MAYNQRIEKLVKNVLTRKRIASSSNLTYMMKVRSATILISEQNIHFICAEESDCSFEYTISLSGI